MSGSIIDYVTWNVTKACNFRCKYCYFPPESAPGPARLPVEKITEFLDATGREWVIGLTGGEPFILPDFVDLCRSLSVNHLLEIDTNLSLTARVREFAQKVDPKRVRDLYVALHIEEREKRNGVPDFIDNVHLLMDKGFHVTVNYVIHPTLVGRYPDDYDYFQKQGLRILPRPFKGVHEGLVYPAGYTPEAMALLKPKPTAGRKMVYNFLGVPCHAGGRLIRVEPDGTVFRCSGDRTVLGNLHREVTLYPEPRPCRVTRCPCFGPDYVVLNQAQRHFMDGVSHFVLDNRPEAAASFEKTLAVDSKASNARYNLGVLAWRGHDPAAARAHMEQALGLHPDNKMYILGHAALLTEMNRRGEAVQALQAFLQKHDDKNVAEYLEMLNTCENPPRPVGLCVDVRSANTLSDIFPMEWKPAGSEVCPD